MTCSSCNGDGVVPSQSGNNTVTCPACRGTGEVPIIDCPECGAQFSSKEAFRSHAREQHGAGR